jgi:hypothetical protein
MSSPILPIQGHFGLAGPTESTKGASADVGAFVSELSASDRVLAIAAARGGPPAEVLDQIAVAGRISGQLRENGTHLRFSAGPEERVTVELLDTKNNTVSKLSITETLEIAAGRPLG